MNISLKKVLLLISMYSFFALLAPTQISWIIMYFLCFGIVAFNILTKKTCVEDRINKRIYIFSSAMLLLIIAEDFVDRWLSSSIIKRISSCFGLNVITFLYIISFILVLLSIYFVAYMLHCLYNTSFFNIFLLSLIEFIQVQCSSLNTLSEKLCNSYSFALANIAFYYCINIFICLVFNKTKKALFVCFMLTTIFSFSCQFVVIFHGSPLFSSELRNVFTALNVIKNYSFSINMNMIFIFLLMIIGVCLIVFPTSQFSICFNRNCLLIFAVGISLFSSALFMTLPINNFDIYINIRDNGYVVMAADDIYKLANPFKKPIGYDDNILVNDSDQSTILNINPDIIVIMNETFYNLSNAVNVKMDNDYLKEFYSIDNASYGYTVVPCIGGGTNDSEYELLTSKSTYLLNSKSPFTWIDLNKSPSSIAQYLKECGYTTTAMHDSEPTNYNRNRAYSDIGFDNAYFNDYFDKSSYGNRNVTDESDYKKLIECYETNKDNNQFIFMLTFQNHGGYEQNDDSLDTIHVTEDYGDLSDDLNEYLTSVNYSAIAFKELTDYFENSEKPAIVCMIGDHAPSFINSLIDDNGSIENEIKKRAVPYVLWSNYGVDFSDCSGYASMTDLVPMIVEKARLPISSFYSTILDLREQFPIRTNFGYVVDSEGNYIKYNENEDKFKLLNNYYYMEYNSLIGGDDYLEELFLPNVK